VRSAALQSPKSEVQSLTSAKRPWTLDLGRWTFIALSENILRARAAADRAALERSP
jgi:hypothetical protein